MIAYTIEKYRLNVNNQWIHDETEYYMNKKLRDNIFIGYLKLLEVKKITSIDFKKDMIDIDETGYYADNSDKFILYFFIGALAFGLGIALCAI